MSHSVSVSATSPGSPQRLWRLVSDLENWPRHLDTFSSVTALQPGPPRLGSRFRVRQPGLATVTYVVTGWVEGEQFTWRNESAGLTGTAEHVVSPQGDGSRLDLRYTWSGPLALPVFLALRARARALIEHEAETFTWLAGEPD